ncbi:SAM-dependent methyltransferase [Sphingopyxis sp. Geo48]|uniref:SAM-dependent methyltransferase n=1 Tax=Sphingopyxis sp. Geo48 TaxID=545241 RepID=UPI0024B6BF9C|nr:SAM-dependent methyltransferase [Sphingopyxis sp. Geo48]
MHYSYRAPAGIIWMAPASGWGMPAPSAQSRAEKDRRWPAVLRKLKGLHKRGRRSIRIVDADCGTGELLLHTVRRAREMGFLAIEGRGIDADPSLVASARRAAARQPDPAIGLVFEQAEKDRVMREEAEYPADLLLCSATDAEARELAALARTAAKTVLWDRTAKNGGEDA